MHTGSSRRDCTIDGKAYRTVPATAGLRSRARSRAAHHPSVEVWLNRVISILRQLWSGKLSDALLATNAGEWAGGPPETVKPSELGESVVPGLCASVRRSLDARPPRFSEWQQGVGLMAPGPSQKGGSKDSSTMSQKSVTRIEAISGQLRLRTSPFARFVDRFESEMLRSPEDRLEVPRGAKKYPTLIPYYSAIC